LHAHTLDESTSSALGMLSSFFLKAEFKSFHSVFIVAAQEVRSLAQTTISDLMDILNLNIKLELLLSPQRLY